MTGHQKMIVNLRPPRGSRSTSEPETKWTICLRVLRWLQLCVRPYTIHGWVHFHPSEGLRRCTWSLYLWLCPRSRGVHGAHPEPASPGQSGYSSRWVGLFEKDYVVWIPSVMCGKEQRPSLVRWLLPFLIWLLGWRLSGSIVEVHTADVSSCPEDFGHRPVLTKPTVKWFMLGIIKQWLLACVSCAWNFDD